MDTLAKLFGSALRVKLIRMFLFQDGPAYRISDIVVRTQSKTPLVRKELKLLEAIDIIRERELEPEAILEITTPAPEPKKGQKKARATKVKKQIPAVMGYVLNKRFPLIRALSELLIESHLISPRDLQKYFSSHTQIKLLILSGVFVKNTESKADIVIVGEKLDTKKISETVKIIEAEIGKEVRYTVFAPEEFMYRMNMYDKYLIDILNNPHERIIEKMEIPKP
jgi:predicted nucleotidyltransferase